MEHLRIQLLGATRLTRIVLPYVLERRGARVVALDPGEEHEADPWFAPVRGLARDNGIPLGRREADLVLDCDPSARPTRPEGVGLRILPPSGSRSPDVNRLILGGDPAWDAVVTEGSGAGAVRRVEAEPRDDAADLLERAALRLVEALDEAWDQLRAPPSPLARPLVGGRWRPQESFVTWELPAASVVKRIRACAGPWGGARTHLGDTPLWLLDAAEVEMSSSDAQIPGTIVAVDEGVTVATGRGNVRIEVVRPGWRPTRRAGAYLREAGLGVGYLLA